MSGFVCIDANIAAKWVLPEEDSTIAQELYLAAQATETLILVPPHLKIEVVNAIRRKVARGLLTDLRRETMLEEFSTFVIQPVEPKDLYLSSLRLAHLYNRPTAYDAHYVALAQIYECDFWTADQRLLNALDGRLSFVRSLADYDGLA